jgi:hypothetical protein
VNKSSLVTVVNRVLKMALISGAIGLAVSLLMMFAKMSSYPEFLEPYPTFGVSLRSLFLAVAVMYGRSGWRGAG